MQPRVALWDQVAGPEQAFPSGVVQPEPSAGLTRAGAGVGEVRKPRHPWEHERRPPTPAGVWEGAQARPPPAGP